MDQSVNLNKKTKIIATIGPSSSDPETLVQLMANGVNVFRINASHISNPQDIEGVVKKVRKVAQDNQYFVGIFLDLQGPKIRLGRFEKEKVTIVDGQEYLLTTDPVVGDDKVGAVSYKGFYDDVSIGEEVYINDGKVKLEVRSKKNNRVHCVVTRGGDLSNYKGINLPQTKINMSAFTKKDEEDIKMAIKSEIDYIALSFVSFAEDVESLNKFIVENGGEGIKIISKIERQLALDNIEGIIDASYCIMVARGDLGVEIGVENVPRAQKKIIRESNKRFKPVIVATQMLESMITSNVATRAEVSDVANAIYDRCDAVMLSGETAVGIDPVSAVKTMANICSATDHHMEEIKIEDKPNNNFFEVHSVATSFCRAADQIAQENDAQFIVAFTSSGNTPLIASKLNPPVPIIAPTDDLKVCHRITLYRGVIPLMLNKKFNDITRWTDMINSAISEMKKKSLVKKGDRLVVTAGIPIGISNGINSIRIVTVK